MLQVNIKSFKEKSCISGVSFFDRKETKLPYWEIMSRQVKSLRHRRQLQAVIRGQ